MKRVLVLLMLLAGLGAFAEGAVLCIPTVGSSSVDAFKPFTDGGTNCNWAAASVLAIQCPGAEICYDPTALPRKADGGHQNSRTDWLLDDGGVSTDGGLDDGGTTPTWSDVGPTASAADLCVNFTANGDPFLLVLNNQERNVALIDRANADGGSSVDCKIAKTNRRALP